MIDGGVTVSDFFATWLPPPGVILLNKILHLLECKTRYDTNRKRRRCCKAECTDCIDGGVTVSDFFATWLPPPVLFLLNKILHLLDSNSFYFLPSEKGMAAFVPIKFATIFLLYSTGIFLR
ncbi:hypothetical protein BCR42DRAFT_389374 [Absidia repens]|uniref:Uncharacterized protein n=1 Tax=Absidia repens TaxID=90262 RepID=A0A1X2IT04_9FUNG|nr:hypothetical protein BCR42DRAFT_389374 [Absidia repens]